MILRGPNTRLDFHIEPGDEFFYQVEGDMELHLKAPGERRQVVAIKEGEIFVCPGGLLIPRGDLRIPGVWSSNANAGRGERRVRLVLRKVR